MKEFVEKLIARLEEMSDADEYGKIVDIEDVKLTTNELAEEYKPKTQADRVRAMPDEELAQFLLRVNTAYSEPCMLGGCKWEDYPTHDKGCKDCFMEYLQSKIE